MKNKNTELLKNLKIEELAGKTWGELSEDVKEALLSISHVFDDTQILDFGIIFKNEYGEEADLAIACEVAEDDENYEVTVKDFEKLYSPSGNSVEFFDTVEVEIYH